MLKIIIIIIFLYLLIGLYFLFYAFCPRIAKKKLFKNKEAKKILSNEMSQNWFKEIKKENLFLNSFDNLKLHSTFLKNKSNKLVIIVPGYTNIGTDMTNAAYEFYQMNYNVMLIDQRAHGLSEGLFSTLGYKETKDLNKWLNFIKKDYQTIILYGMSMGATTCMLTINKSIDAIIEDSGFKSLISELERNLKYKHLPEKAIIFSANIWSMLILHLNIYKINYEQIIKENNIPTLYIHGENDHLVPIKDMEYLYNNHQGKKEKLIIKNATHMKSSYVNYELYWQTINKFLKK